MKIKQQFTAEVRVSLPNLKYTAPAVNITTRSDSFGRGQELIVEATSTLSVRAAQQDLENEVQNLIKRLNAALWEESEE